MVVNIMVYAIYNYAYHHVHNFTQSCMVHSIIILHVLLLPENLCQYRKKFGLCLKQWVD